MIAALICLLHVYTVITGTAQSIQTSLSVSKRQTIETESYYIKVPSNWIVKKHPGGVTSLDFYVNETKTGWLWKLGYIAYGNQYEVVEEKYLNDDESIFMVKLLRYKSAASNDPTVRKEIHFYINDTKSSHVYDLAFYTDIINEDITYEILKSFKIK
jgi:hypothetical protein